MRIDLPVPTLVVPPFVGGAKHRSVVQWNEAGDEFLYVFQRPDQVFSANARMHYMARATKTRNWRSASGELSRFVGRLEGRWYVQCSLPFRVAAARRDPHNFTSTVCKAVIDGMTDDRLPDGTVIERVWPDDTPEFIHMADPICRVVRRPDHLLVGVHGWRFDDG